MPKPFINIVLKVSFSGMAHSLLYSGEILIGNKFFVVSNTCFVDSSNNDSIGNSSFVNFVFPYPTTATFFNHTPPKMLK